jgi:hypothetical protein
MSWVLCAFSPPVNCVNGAASAWPSLLTVLSLMAGLLETMPKVVGSLSSKKGLPGLPAPASIFHMDWFCAMVCPRLLGSYRVWLIVGRQQTVFRYAKAETSWIATLCVKECDLQVKWRCHGIHPLESYLPKLGSSNWCLLPLLLATAIKALISLCLGELSQPHYC